MDDGRGDAHRAARTPVVPKWKKVPQVPCGRRVQKTERYKFLDDMSKPSRGLTSAMVIRQSQKPPSVPAIKNKMRLGRMQALTRIREIYYHNVRSQW
jgi:hypothetical protein